MVRAATNLLTQLQSARTTLNWFHRYVGRIEVMGLREGVQGRKAGARGGQGELTEERRAALVKTGRATAERILDQLAEAYEQEHQRNNPAVRRGRLFVDECVRAVRREG